MKRRDVVRLVPLSIAGIASSAFGSELCIKKRCGGHKEPLSVQYSRKVKKRLKWIRDNQTENLMEAAYVIARTVENGGKCFQESWDAGHTNSDSWPGRNGEPEIFNVSPGPKKKGDLVLTSSQRSYDKSFKDTGVFLIGCPSSWSADARYPELLRDDVHHLKLRPIADLFIENNATTFGGVVLVPGMPAPIGPVSGIVGKITIWMMLADACRILARRGISVPVKGDEPEVTGEKIDYTNFSGWANLSEPLMDNYFNEVMNQLELVFAEIGTIRKIAQMAVDSVLSGGKIYGYSLHDSIYGEASTRRSGLSITRGVKGSNDKIEDFKGTSKDFVIIGITKPDDEMDLKFLDMFRKRGMKVSSLGTTTRSIKTPDGRTVPKETDLHAGKMCDTYGLFAIPGLKQRICPTSGVVLDHLYWCTIMEFVEQYIEQSGGDVPGVYFSGALKGGMEHLYYMRELFSGD